jgi:hypothetical protein
MSRQRRRGPLSLFKLREIVLPRSKFRRRATSVFRRPIPNVLAALAKCVAAYAKRIEFYPNDLAGWLSGGVDEAGRSAGTIRVSLDYEDD